MFPGSPNPLWCLSKGFGVVIMLKGSASFREGCLTVPQCLVYIPNHNNPAAHVPRRGAMLAFGPWKISVCLWRRGLYLPKSWHLCGVFLRGPDKFPYSKHPFNASKWYQDFCCDLKWKDKCSTFLFVNQDRER